jgi:hypothetical protein
MTMRISGGILAVSVSPCSRSRSIVLDCGGRISYYKPNNGDNILTLCFDDFRVSFLRISEVNASISFLGVGSGRLME